MAGTGYKDSIKFKNVKGAIGHGPKGGLDTVHCPSKELSSIDQSHSKWFAKRRKWDTAHWQYLAILTSRDDYCLQQVEPWPGPADNGGNVVLASGG
jgi:hypothetical protein